MAKTKATHFSPDEIFEQALGQVDFTISTHELHVLTSGLSALREAEKQTINENEKKSIAAMIAYVAETQNTSAETVRAIVLSHFKVDDMKMMPARRYQAAVEFLLDLEIKTVVN